METIKDVDTDYQRAVAITSRVIGIDLNTATGRKSPVAIARRLVVSVLRLTGYGLAEVARVVGFRQHSGVCYHLSKHRFACNAKDDGSIAYNLAFLVIWKEFTLGIELPKLTRQELGVLFYYGHVRREQIINPKMPVKNYEFVKRNDLNAALEAVRCCVGIDLLTYKPTNNRDRLAYMSYRIVVCLLKQQSYGLHAIAIALKMQRWRAYQIYSRHLKAMEREGSSFDEYRLLLIKSAERFKMLRQLNAFASEECDVPVGPSPYVFVGLPKKSAS